MIIVMCKNSHESDVKAMVLQQLEEGATEAMRKWCESEFPDESIWFLVLWTSDPTVFNPPNEYQIMRFWKNSDEVRIQPPISTPRPEYAAKVEEVRAKIKNAVDKIQEQVHTLLPDIQLPNPE